MSGVMAMETAPAGVFPWSGESGMTIIEAVIACLVLSLALASSLASMTMLRGVAHSAGIRLETMHEARSVLEELTAMPYSSQSLSVGKHDIGSWHYRVSMNDEFETTKDIELTVDWYDVATGKDNEMALHTSLALCQHP